MRDRELPARQPLDPGCASELRSGRECLSKDLDWQGGTRTLGGRFYRLTEEHGYLSQYCKPVTCTFTAAQRPIHFEHHTVGNGPTFTYLLEERHMEENLTPRKIYLDPGLGPVEVQNKFDMWRVQNITRWREQNPDAFHTWTTKYGCVIQFWGFRVYYGKCDMCGVLITDRRDISGHISRGPTYTGTWRKYCNPCRDAKAATRARGGMRRSRASRRNRRASDDARLAANAVEDAKGREGREKQRAEKERRRNGFA